MFDAAHFARFLVPVLAESAARCAGRAASVVALQIAALHCDSLSVHAELPAEVDPRAADCQSTAETRIPGVVRADADPGRAILMLHTTAGSADADRSTRPHRAARTARASFAPRPCARNPRRSAEPAHPHTCGADRTRRASFAPRPCARNPRLFAEPAHPHTCGVDSTRLASLAGSCIVCARIGPARPFVGEIVDSGAPALNGDEHHQDGGKDGSEPQAHPGAGRLHSDRLAAPSRREACGRGVRELCRSSFVSRIGYG